jgi:type I restriction enzyme M protein
VSIADIKSRGYNLDIKNPNAPEDTHEDPDVLLDRFVRERAKAAEIRGQLRDALAAALEGRA